MKNKPRKRCVSPIMCQACKANIEIGQIIINHHVSYFPEIIIQVHGRCHGLIHKTPSDFPDLKPDPRQVIRWYRKKGGFINFHEDCNDWLFRMFLFTAETGFLTEERIENIRFQKLEDYLKNMNKFPIILDWISS